MVDAWRVSTRAEHSTVAVALGAALLAVAVGVTQFRLDAEWGDGVHLAVAAVAAAALLVAGLRGRPAGDRPPAWVSALLLAGLALFALAAFRLIEVILDGDDPFEDDAGLTAYFALLTAVAAVCFVRSASAACLLVAALAAGGTVLAAIHWVFDTENIASYRPALLVLAVVYVAGAFALRGRPRHRDVMVDAAGLAIFAIAALGGFFFFFLSDSAPDAWEAVILGGGLALVAYTAVTHAPGPGVLALFLLYAFGSSVVSGADSGEIQVIDAEGEAPEDAPNLMGWPLVLLAMSLLALGYGMLSGRRNRDHDPDRAVQPSH